MDLRSYCRLLMRRWPVLLTVFLVVGAALAGAGFLIPSTYTANARIVFAPKLSGFVSMGTRQEAQTYVADRMKTYAQLVTTNRVLQPVIDSLNLGVTVPDLVKKIEVTIPTETLVINVAVSAPTAAKAAATANRIAQVMSPAVADLEGAPLIADSPVQVEVLQPADIPVRRSSPKVLLNLIVAVGVAIVVAVFAAVVTDNFDTRVRRRRDVTALNVPFLGGIPEVHEAETPDLFQFMKQAPELQSILHRIAIDVLYAADQTPTRLIFTSPRAGAGKTMVAANVAGALAAAGKRVAFIDADVRGGRLAARVGIEQTRGITDLVSGRLELDESSLQSKWGGFTIVPCGGSAIDVGEMLAGEKFGELMTALAHRFDVVIVDAPPIINLGDASLFTQNIPNVVVVAAVKTRRAELLQVAGSLRHSGAKILGVVLSRVRKDEQSAPANADV
ncbi:polysaccharide biosynthesis tyrosine autokinase [Mycolicibacterium pallens]|uniref:Polysaccharide biosynthesis tyrosine autokinase n=1 Tax=Mycolicibacterium pallens TaxID=370524 RepID=A0ABX8VP31_9MYCO|nr:polysaccharide biosynthesis tyrosine autokinase [Mycolicibacterium pallens]APE16982.1 hypothetical protein BOH72_18775 [Mycobacterium sp. WY10]QYL17540.1 polysaccharide biosynthesis tyrosine autokinase [Mycolicibacterium pallens]